MSYHSDRWAYDYRDARDLGRENRESLESIEQDLIKIKDALYEILRHLGLKDKANDLI